MYLCVCHALNESDLRNLVKLYGCVNLDDLSCHTSAGQSCGSCLAELEEALRRVTSERESEPGSTP